MVKTNGRIEHLQSLVGKTVNMADKAALNAEIQILIAEQAKMQAFIDLYAKKFSLFGWLAKKDK